jgi:hypothetical protein
MAVVITGFQKSGKTLLRKLCNQHPSVALLEGAKIFGLQDASYAAHARRLGREWWKGRPIDPRSQELAPSRLRAASFVARYLVELLVRGHGRASLTDVEAVLRHMFPRASVVGDAHGSYVFALDRLAHLEELSVVVIYRDCRDVTSSLLHKVARRPHGAGLAARYGVVGSIARKWTHAVENMERHADRVFCVRYEELVSASQQVLPGLAEWLAVDPGGFSPWDLKTDWVGEYKDHLSPQQLDEVVSMAGAAMMRLGYL